jgi:hypothetical protein
MGATTVDGSVMSPNWIQYAHPLTGRTLTHNNFWDLLDPPPGNWANFTPADWITTQWVTCSIQVQDSGTGLDVSAAQYAFSTDGGSSWSAWQPASCTGSAGTLTPETITTAAVPFEQDSQPTDVNLIRFRITDLGGNTGESGVHSVLIDTTAPQIIAGPQVSNVSPNSAVIVWQTNENSDSVVRYDHMANQFSLIETNTNSVTNHNLSLQNLEPSRTYHFLVSSTDHVGNKVESHDLNFETAALPDEIDPTVSINDPGLCSGLVSISANASDNHEVKKVEFIIDDVLVYTAYSSDFKFMLDTTEYANGLHSLRVRSYDLAGRVAEDDRVISVDNEIDTAIPTVTITSPSPGVTVSTTISIQADLSDDTGLRKAYFYFTPFGAQQEVYYGFYAFPYNPKQDTATFKFDTTVVKDGDYRIGIEVHDKEYNVGYGTCDVTVNNAAVPDAKLVVTKQRVHRISNFFTIELTVTNVGPAAASDIKIWNYMDGFQPVRSISSTADYVGIFSPTLKHSICEINSHINIPSGVSRVFTYQVVPVLIDSNQPTPQIGSVTWLFYKNPGGKQFADKSSYPVPKTTSGEFIPHAHQNAVQTADYIIATNPGLLYGLCQKTGVNILLSTMAQLAKLKEGVLGYMSSYDKHLLKNLIKPGGNWAKKLKPEFSTLLGGYLLIVGESEIMPAWYQANLPGPRWGNEKESGTVSYSDHPYADTGGGPNLIVGRIIGDSAAELTKPIQTSIAVHEGTAGYAFDRNQATLISGPGLGNFPNNVDEVAKILQSEFSVKKMHWKDYYTDTIFNRSYDQLDGLAVGDVLGDAKAEIILADHSAKKIYVYDASGANLQKLQEFSCGYNTIGFDAGDKIAVGNYNIIMADSSADYILIYNGYGVLQSYFAMNFEASDGLAVGDVTSDGYDEIIIADTSANRIFVLTLAGLIIYDFQRDFEKYDSLVVGDILGYSKDQIIIADRSANKILIFSASGLQLGSHEYGSANWLYSIGDGSTFAAGNVRGLTAELLLTVPAIKYRHLFAHRWDSGKPEKRDQIPFDFDNFDAVAVGNLKDIMQDADTDEIVIGDSDSDQIVVLDWDLWNSVRRVHNDLPSFTKEADVIYWSGHGNKNVWSDNINSHWDPNPVFPIDFANHNPFVMTSSCLTGNYQLSDREADNIAESFLDSGAAVYIGSTQEAFHPSEKAAEEFFKNWSASDPIGKAFTHLERTGWTIDGHWKFYAWEYNLYGDPKFGAVSGQIQSEDGQAIEGPAAGGPNRNSRLYRQYH